MILNKNIILFLHYYIFSIMLISYSTTQYYEVNSVYHERSSNNIYLEDALQTNSLETELLNSTTYNVSSNHQRKKRSATFAWPFRSKFTAELYYLINIPDPIQTLDIAFGGSFAFTLPNSSALYPKPVYTKPPKLLGKRSLEDRSNIYETIEGVLHTFGFDGRSCLQKAICEKSELNFRSGDVFEDILHLILSLFSTSSDPYFDGYLEAEKYGQSSGNCRRKYSCSFSIFSKTHFFDSSTD